MAQSKLKFFVGVDLGTTASALSYVISNKDRLSDIEIVDTYPDESEIVSKVPSRIAFAKENSELANDEWGFSVTGTMVQYTWFKLLLDRNVKLTEFDDESLRDLLGNGMCRTPVDKSPQDVCTAYLRCLHQYFVHFLEKKFRPEVVKVTPVEYWVTVPAIWSDKAKSATLAAAKAAGFGSRPTDKVCLISEPEAAALAALKPHIGPDVLDPVHPDESILVCDCGGGTVDITTYTVLNTHPELKFQELCFGMGGKCGSTAIDRNFNKWMHATFGQAYEDVKLQRRSPGSKFMRSFESAKKNFGSNPYGGNEGKIIQVDIWMQTRSSELYDEDDGTLMLTPKLMKTFFDPVVADVIRLVESQISLAKNRYGKVIDRIILVGGFGDSEYLIAQMRLWCERNRGIKLTCPPHCQAAIVRGAALRGLENILPVQRKARRHYGFSCAMPFREGIDDERDAFFGIFENQKYCNQRIEWVVHKDTPIDEFSMHSYPLESSLRAEQMSYHSTLGLYCSENDDAPGWCRFAQKVGEIPFSYNEADMATAEHAFNHHLQCHVKKIKMSVEVDLNAEEGVLQLKTNVGGRTSGKAQIEFE
ncbi:actin-like ATPase domain-containing protein [Saccharata proteae CBS 121410]|uniref:Actin-like ATPase domain-containing protein n=1 Tax=Saccharata proteae CBS 121410 TaxID=1314787 RepID=A0A9P4HS97_9PEZI|nr:actin-like ATPase domain-containing protein [Saccharata proteae CBS 121410]